MSDKPHPWAHPGTDVLVGLREPLQPRQPGILVPALITLDLSGRLTVSFTPPNTHQRETIELARLGDTWDEVHTSATGHSWSVRAFPPDSPAHLSWQIKETQVAIGRLVNTKAIDRPEIAAEIATLADALQQLVRRHSHTTTPAPATAAA